MFKDVTPCYVVMFKGLFNAKRKHLKLMAFKLNFTISIQWQY